MNRGVLAWGVSGLVLVLAGATVVLAVVNGGDLNAAGFALPFLPFALVGGLVASRRPDNRVSWCMLAIPLAIIGYAFCEQYATLAFVTRPGALPGATIIAWLGAALWVPSAFLMVVVLPLWFPDGRVLSPRWRLVGWVGAAAAVAIFVPAQVFAWSRRGPALLDDDTWAAMERLVVPLFLVMLVCGVVAFVSLIIRYRRGSPVERAQLRWFAAALGLVLAAFLLSPLIPEAYPVEAMANSLVPIAVGVAVLRYRLYEIDRIISRTVSYALLTLVLAAVYAAGVVGLGGLVRAVTGGGGGDLVVAASTLLVVAAFGPVRTRVQASVDRRFNRTRYDAQRTVEALTQRLRDEVDLDALSNEVRGVVVRTVQPTSLTLWLRPGATAPTGATER